MPQEQPVDVAPEMLRLVAEQLLHFPVAEEDLPGIAAMLNALAADMRAFRAMPLADDEPATMYHADEVDA